MNAAQGEIDHQEGSDEAREGAEHGFGVSKGDMAYSGKSMEPAYHGAHQMSMYPRYADSGGRYPPHMLQTVVTSSFSAEEREYARAHEQRYDREERFLRDGEREDWPQQGSGPSHAQYHGMPPSHLHTPYPVQRAYSLPVNYQSPQTLKRSYFHHSTSKEATRDLPPDFMPPVGKKVKTGAPPDKEIPLSRYPSGMLSQRSLPLCKRANTWDGDEVRYKYAAGNQYYGQPASHWAPPMPFSPRSPARPPVVLVTPERKDEVGTFPQPWRPVPQRWMGQSSSSAWNPATPSVAKDPVWTPPIMKMPPIRETSSGRDDRLGLMVEAAAAADSRDREDASLRSDGSTDNRTRTRLLPSGEVINLLALTKDKGSLSETLCLIREVRLSQRICLFSILHLLQNIEVFTATQRDVDAPAPGRKHPVVVGQVGLRCIHCRHALRCSDRVKRAVCYPSSIKRIYRTVIDMKLDHFTQCKFVPQELKDRLRDLKAVHTRSTGTTMQYFIRAAHTLGMEDADSGVRLSKPEAPVSSKTDQVEDSPIKRSGSDASSSTSPEVKTNGSMMSAETSGSSNSNSNPGDTVYHGIIPLSLPEDESSLSPLRCFLRKHVCAFSATEEDTCSRAPTTVSIAVGQVGIGCIHCVKDEVKYRSNRAICFPFSIARIYQSVADIQRFHMADCTSMPADVKKQFLELQWASSKGSKGLSTRQYWITSAKRLGLVDTTHGLRFSRDPTKPEEKKAFSLDILAQVAISVTTSDKQLVVPEDKETIAEFLYVVMEQLQPCRFTEADRNKRRLKDVGCIGVECKHCAGKVDGRKFFWSSLSAVESNFVSVHTHMLECRMVPDELKKRISTLKQLRKEQTAALPTGSQKAFFSRVWDRLHDDQLQEEKGNDSSLASDDMDTGNTDHIKTVAL